MLCSCLRARKQRLKVPLSRIALTEIEFLKGGKLFGPRRQQRQAGKIVDRQDIAHSMLAEAPSHGKPVSLYDSKSRGAEAYRELALELLTRNHMESPEAKRRKAAAAAAASSLKSFHVPEKKSRFWKSSKEKEKESEQ